MRNWILISFGTVTLVCIGIGSFFYLFGFGPLDPFPRTSKVITCSEAIDVTVYRKKFPDNSGFIMGPLGAFDTDNRIRIMRDRQTLLDDRLYWADTWNDVKPYKVKLSCNGDEISTSASGYFDVSYRVTDDGVSRHDTKLSK